MAAEVQQWWQPPPAPTFARKKRPACNAGNACCSRCGCQRNMGEAPVAAGRGGYTAEQWEQWLKTPEGQHSYRWWAEWIPTPAGEQWSFNKRYEAKLLVQSMIQAWGIDTLRAGSGVVEIGGDPGFVASELLCNGIPATVVDPAFGLSGKASRYSQEAYCDWGQWQGQQAPFTVLKEPFDSVFLENASNADILRNASAIVSLYPDEVTAFVLDVSVEHNMRTVVIPCNECAQYFPPHNPTYEGFVQQLLQNDYGHAKVRNCHTAPLQRSVLMGSPFCQVLLHRTPNVGW